jgi:hypothetical protein
VVTALLLPLLGLLVVVPTALFGALVEVHLLVEAARQLPLMRARVLAVVRDA